MAKACRKISFDLEIFVKMSLSLRAKVIVSNFFHTAANEYIEQQ
jgi:hypothetical protein